MSDQKPLETSADKQNGLDAVLFLSTELNRRAFDNPPPEGWLNSFLTVVLERFAPLAIQGIQVVQVIGNVAVSIGKAGAILAETVGQFTIDPTSPIAIAMNTRQMATALTQRIYPVLIGKDIVAVVIVYTGTARSRDATETIDQAFALLTLQLGPAVVQTLRTPGPRTGRLTNQIEMMRSLYEVTRTVSATLEGSDSYKEAARSLVDSLHVDHAEIVVFDRTHNTARVAAESPDTGQANVEIPLRGYYLLDRFERDPKPLVISRADIADTFAPDQKDLLASLQQAKARSALILPMLAHDTLVGAIGIHTYETYREFRAEEIEAGAAIASQLAISVRNTELYNEIKRRADQLENIGDLSRRVTATFDRQTIFQIVKEDTQKLIESDLISVALRSGDGALLQLFILGDSAPAMTEFQTEQSGLSLVAQAAEPLVLDDISGSEHLDYKLLAQSRMRAAIIVPLIVGRKVIGTFNVLHRRAGFYTADDLAVLEQIGNQVAIALENARIYNQTAERANTEELMNQLNVGVQVAGDVQNVLLGTTRQIAQALGARKARVRLQTPSPSAPTLDAAAILSISNKLSSKREG